MNILLVLLHSGDVVAEGALLVPAGGGEEPQEAGQLLPVGRVFVDAKLQVLAELLIELLEVVLVLADLLQQLHHLLDPVLPYDLEDLVLLEHLPGDVKGHVLAVHDALDEVEVLWDGLLAVFISYWCCSIYAAPMGAVEPCSPPRGAPPPSPPSWCPGIRVDSPMWTKVESGVLARGIG